MSRLTARTRRGLGQEQAKKGEALAIRKEEEGEDEDRQVDSIEGGRDIPCPCWPEPLTEAEPKRKNLQLQ